MEFHQDIRLLLKRASQMALLSGDDLVELNHLLECDPLQGPAEFIVEREILFSSDVLYVLGEAAEMAAKEPSSEVLREHLELAALRAFGKLADWSPCNQAEGFWGLLNSQVRQSLENRGVDLEKLEAVRLVKLGESLQGRACQRFLAATRRLPLRIEFLPLLVLLGHCIARGETLFDLYDAGVTETILLSVMQGLEPTPRVQVTFKKPADEPKALDFERSLGPGAQRLSKESRNTLGLAWLVREGQELSGRDLLRALIAVSDRGERRCVRELLLSLRPTNQFVEQLTRLTFHEDLNGPVLSAEIYRVFARALQEAENERRVTNLDLLVGLAECGQELLIAEGISVAEIRQRWSEGF